MKKISLLFAAILFFATLHAQDVITLKNGTQLRGTVTDVNLNTVKYQKAGGADTTTYSIAKSDVLVIDYKDGSTLMLNSLTPTDQHNQYGNFLQRTFIDIGGCFNTQFGVKPPYDINNKTKIDFASSVNLGVTVSRRVQLGIELTYQTLNYNSNTSSTIPYVVYSGTPPNLITYTITYLRSNEIMNNQNTYMYVIPNVIITANHHKFTPYAKMGALIIALNKIYINDNSVDYNSSGAVIGVYPYQNTILDNPNVGLYFAGGSTMQLNKHFSIFGEAYVNGTFTDEFTIMNSSAIGINAGIRITL